MECGGNGNDYCTKAPKSCCNEWGRANRIPYFRRKRRAPDYLCSSVRFLKVTKTIPSFLMSSVVICFFSLEVPDTCNCISVGRDKGLVKYIIQDQNSDVYVLYQPFKVETDFFECPLLSSQLGIYQVSELCASIKCAALTEVTCKYTRLPCKERFVLIPLLHQFV